MVHKLTKLFRALAPATNSECMYVISLDQVHRLNPVNSILRMSVPSVVMLSKTYKAQGMVRVQASRVTYQLLFADSNNAKSVCTEISILSALPPTPDKDIAETSY